MEQWKVCIVCEAEKPPGAFYADHRMRDGRLNRCKDCCVAASQQRRTDRKEGCQGGADARTAGRDQWRDARGDAGDQAR